MNSLMLNFWVWLASLMLATVVIMLTRYISFKLFNSYTWWTLTVSISGAFLSHTGWIARSPNYHGLLVGLGWFAYVIGGSIALCGLAIFLLSWLAVRSYKKPPVDLPNQNE